MGGTAKDAQSGNDEHDEQLRDAEPEGNDAMGNGGKLVWKGNGKGGNKGGGKGGKDGGNGMNPNSQQGNAATWNTPCGRCGGMHPRSQCPAYLNQTICQQCYLPGHLESHCRSLAVDDTTICKCCGEAGHTKKDCPKNTDPCGRCKVRGQTENVCAHPPGYVPKEKHLLKLKNQAAPAGAKQQAPGGALRCELCGPDNVHEFKWICENCGGLVIDDGDKATKCPGCSVAKGKKQQTTPQRHPRACYPR